MDRIDIHIDVWRTPPAHVLKAGKGTSSAKLREGVVMAREFAARRKMRSGDDGSSQALIRACALAEPEEEFIQDMARLHHIEPPRVL